MSFNSYIFILLFLPLVLLGYYGINRTGRYKQGLFWLLGMSCWFYGAFAWQYLLLFGITICINQLGVCGMEKTEKKNKRFLFILLLLMNIGLLLYFKYFDFFIENINRAFGAELPILQLALPVGISFYTFRQLSYVIDCYRGEVKPYSFLEYAVYALFFPLLIQGPIARHEEIVAQLREEDRKRPDYENLSKGFYAFSRGLAKKVLIADTLSPVVAMVFHELYAFDSTNVVLAMFSYSFQIYFDFSGYCDMAYGIGKMCNLELPINFSSPYKAVSISDFWDRWHITLTKFFTKYVYIPLGGSRRGLFRTCLNTMLVFLVSGFWHGAEWTFIIWGAFHGSFMVLERLCGKAFKKIPKGIRVVCTFLIVTAGWSIFRSPTAVHSKIVFEQIGIHKFGGVSTRITEYFNELTEVRLFGRLGMQGIIDAWPAFPFLLFFVLCFVFVWTCKNTKEKVESWNFEEPKRFYGKMAATVALFTWSVLSLSQISEFIYFNF